MQYSMMTRALGAAVLGLGLAMAADATPREDSFTVSFHFSPDAPVERTYNDFVKTAKRACRANTLPISLVPRIDEATRECEEELMQQAVLKTRMASLIDYHESKAVRDN